jgi:ABC-type ATPase involved in cell division
MATHNLELVRRSDFRTIELNRGRLVFDSAEAARADGSAVEGRP